MSLGQPKIFKKPDTTINISLDMKEYYEILDRKTEKEDAEDKRQADDRIEWE